MICRIIIFVVWAVIPAIPYAAGIRVALLGSQNIAVEVAENPVGSAPLLRVMAGETERFRLEVAPQCFERRGVGYQGGGSEWNFAEEITEIKRSVLEDGSIQIEAKASFRGDRPAERPYTIQYKVTIAATHLELDFISIMNDGEVPFRFLCMACPVRINGEVVQKKMDGKSMRLEFPEGEYWLRTVGEHSSFASDIMLLPRAPLWLEKGIVWYDFVDSLRIDFSAQQP